MLMGVASVGPAAPISKGLLHILLTLLLLQIQAPVSYGASSENDSKVLLNFKTSLSPAKAFDTWNIQASANPCSGTWKGVLCYNGVVWGLQLEKMDLTGQIDVEALVPLHTLRSISLMNNKFEGEMPDWRKLGALKSLFLCGKPLESPCPDISPAADDDGTSNNSPVQLGGPPSQAASSSVNTVTIIIVGTAGVAAIFVVLVICRQNRKEVPQLGKMVSSSASLPPSSTAASPIRKQHHDLQIHQAGTAAKSASPEMNNMTVPKKGEPGSKLSFVREDRQQFDLTDLLRASAEVLGSGNLGSSYKAVLMDDQALVVKRFNQMHNVVKEDFHEHMRRLGRLEHPNLLPLVAYYYRKEEKLLVYDFIQNGSLASHLHGNHSAEKPALDWPTRLNIIKGVAKGLAYLHRELPASLNTPHGHLKSSNVVLDKCFQPLLMDYGLVPVVNREHVQNLLVAYKSPEFTKCSRVTRKSDVWNLGILILETLTSKFPTNYLTQDGSVHYRSRESSSSSLSSSSPALAAAAAWAGFVGGEDFDSNNSSNAMSVFDAEMENRDNSLGEMMKLLKIGIACCEEDEDKRLDLKEAVDEIEAIKERDL